MANIVIMPRMGQSVESCVITEWNKKVGDEVKTGDVLFSYETDKSSFEEEAKEDGVLLAVLANVDDDVPCLDPVCIIGKQGEDISELLKQAGASGEAPAAEAPAAAPKAEEAPAAPAAETASAAAPAKATGSAGSAPASPRARMTAEKLHVDISAATPTGPNGRIIERDVIAAGKTTSAVAGVGGSAGIEGTGVGGRVTTRDLENPAAKAVVDLAGFASEAEAAAKTGFHDEKMPHLRQVIAKTMLDSMNGMAQLTHSTSFDITNIAAYRKAIKAATETMGLPKITYNDIMLYAVSRTLLHYPMLNAHLMDGNTMRYFDHVHLGMAVDTPRGLLVVTIFYADTKSLVEIANEAHDLAAQAQSGKINPDLLQGQTFTVTNLGTFGIESFTPIISKPQTGILGVDCIMDKVRRGADGGVELYQSMGLSLTYDHRAMDGVPASKFLKELKESLENFTVLLAK